VVLKNCPEKRRDVGGFFGMGRKAGWFKTGILGYFSRKEVNVEPSMGIRGGGQS